MSKKISIIIPCYNTEKYIQRCFNSIKAQTIGLSCLEVIFVNDCSTDDTLSILTALEEQYPEDIMVINLSENSKAGIARNVALSYASSPYIGYIDSDDWIEPNMFEELLKAIEKYDCDFVECYWDNAINERQKSPVKVLGEAGYYDLTNPKVRERFFGNQIALTSVWNKLFKKEFLINNDITFPGKLRYEDIPFCYYAFLYAKSYYRINKPLYHYFCNENGVVLQRGKEYQFDKMDIALDFLNECKTRGIYDINAENKNAIDWMFLEKYYIYMLWEVFNQFEELSYPCYIQMREQVLTLIPDYAGNPYRSWESNAFDSFMLKLLDTKLDEESLLSIKDKLLKKFR